MSNRILRFEVKVVEVDDANNVLSTLCSHTMYYPKKDYIGRQDELLQCAYEGFDLARNKFDGLFDNQPDGL